MEKICNSCGDFFESISESICEECRQYYANKDEEDIPYELKQDDDESEENLKYFANLTSPVTK